jgi:GNAT superfamily N-acetyltransferase
VLGQFPPGTCRTPLRQQVRIALPLLSLNVGDLWRLWRWVGASEARDLAVRHWHLGPVAVDPDRQGRGIGSEMLRAFCARMDRQGEVAFLETDKLASVRFYARCGFKQTARAEVLGTPNWWMHRPPAAPPPPFPTALASRTWKASGRPCPPAAGRGSLDGQAGAVPTAATGPKPKRPRARQPKGR